MKTRPFFVIGIGSIVSGMTVIIYTILDYQNRVYEYRYLPSTCKVGSSCPFVVPDDRLVWLGIAMIVTGIILILFKKLQSRGNKK